MPTWQSTEESLDTMHLLRVLTALRKGDFVVVCTTSAQPHDIDLCYQLGANSYTVKPVDFERLRHALELLTRY